MSDPAPPLPVVLLPGMMCDARLFASQVAALSRERSVMVAPLTGADRVPALAARVLADAPGRFVLGGLSMGGIVAMEVARQAPERLAGLILMDTNPLAETSERAAARAPQVAEVRAGGLRRVMAEEMKPHYLAPGARRAEVLEVVLDMALALGPEVFIRQSDALRTRPDQCDTLRGLGCPALILCGAADTLCPVARHEMMARLIPGATLRVIEGAGHLPTLERPQAVNGAIADFLLRLS